MWMAALTVSTSAKHVAGDAAVGVAAVEPDGVGVADVADDVAAEEHVAGAVELGPGGFPGAFGVRPAAPLDEIVFDEGVLGSHAADAFDAAVADRVAADDVICRRPAARRAAAAAPVAVADVEADAVGPFDGVAFDDPVIAAGGGDQAALRGRIAVAGVLEGDSLEADVAEAASAAGRRPVRGW